MDTNYVVICLEGCHGSGKTALTAEFRRLGYAVMDEGFLDQPETLLHPQVRARCPALALSWSISGEVIILIWDFRAPVGVLRTNLARFSTLHTTISPFVTLQSLLMETAWVCGWFQRLMAHISEKRKAGDPSRKGKVR